MAGAGRYGVVTIIGALFYSLFLCAFPAVQASDFGDSSVVDIQRNQPVATTSEELISQLISSSIPTPSIYSSRLIDTNPKYRHRETLQYYPKGVLRYHETYEYDRSDNLYRISSFSKDNELIDTLIYEYNDKGDIIKSTSYNKDGTVESQYSFIYIYNNKNQLIKEYVRGTNINICRSFEYNSLGRMKKGKYFENGILNTTYIYKYNVSNKVIKIVRFNKKGISSGFTTYKYNKEKLSTQVFSYNQDSTLSLYQIYDYNEQGLNTKLSLFDPDGTLLFYNLAWYNTDGLTVKRRSFPVPNSSPYPILIMYQMGTFIYTYELY